MMNTKVENVKKAWSAMSEGWHGLPGVKTSNNVAKMASREQGVVTRAHTASAAATPPDSKAGIVGSQQV